MIMYNIYLNSLEPGYHNAASLFLFHCDAKLFMQDDCSEIAKLWRFNVIGRWPWRCELNRFARYQTWFRSIYHSGLPISSFLKDWTVFILPSFWPSGRRLQAGTAGTRDAGSIIVVEGTCIWCSGTGSRAMNSLESSWIPYHEPCHPH
jgi:hypothetical protein